MHTLKMEIPVEEARRLRGSLVARFPDSEVLKAGHESLVLVDKTINRVLVALNAHEEQHAEDMRKIEVSK